MVLIAMVRHTEMIGWQSIFGVSMAAILAVMLAGCTATELRDALHIGGKVVYDSLKNISENPQRDGQ